MNLRRFGIVLIAVALVAGACGDDPPRELSGYRREPAPMVGDITLPDHR